MLLMTYIIAEKQ